ncbi:MAG: hypothetical protein FWF46_06015 [Oscillospiraceae bacterium]|nr:hypothetical protein [Oscillospiraceae bacterium]
MRTKRESMKFKCKCGNEMRIKRIMLGYITKCSKCNRNISKVEAEQEIINQKKLKRGGCFE